MLLHRHDLDCVCGGARAANGAEMRYQNFAKNQLILSRLRLS
jgi:hypothetical protein